MRLSPLIAATMGWGWKPKQAPPPPPPAELEPMVIAALLAALIPAMLFYHNFFNRVGAKRENTRKVTLGFKPGNKKVDEYLCLPCAIDADFQSADMPRDRTLIHLSLSPACPLLVSIVRALQHA